MTGDALAPAGGRHRLGSAGLRHCRDIARVRDRLGHGRYGAHRRSDRIHAAVPEARATTAAPATPDPPAAPEARATTAVRRSAAPATARAARGRPVAAVTGWRSTVGGVVVAGVLTVSGWYTAAGASAIAQMLGP